jgi:hypothetical protein
MGKNACRMQSEVDKDYWQAAHLAAAAIAEKIAPYRHARLSAVKLAGDPNNPVRIHDNASLDELRELVKLHYDRLAPILDLKSLVPPADGIANGGNDTGAPGE